MCVLPSNEINSRLCAPKRDRRVKPGDDDERYAQAASQPVEIRAISTILDLVILDLVTRGLDPRVPLRRACATRR
jgi:hypothetical protein